MFAFVCLFVFVFCCCVVVVGFVGFFLFVCLFFVLFFDKLLNCASMIIAHNTEEDGKQDV